MQDLCCAYYKSREGETKLDSRAREVWRERDRAEREGRNVKDGRGRQETRKRRGEIRLLRRRERKMESGRGAERCIVNIVEL